jgi:hypothetical protein
MAKEKSQFKPEDKKQSKLFIKKAREIGADKKHSAADALLGRMAKMKPEPHVASKDKAK